LAEVPADRLRIGLGNAGVGPGVAALDEHLATRCEREAVA